MSGAPRPLTSISSSATISTAAKPALPTTTVCYHCGEPLEAGRQFEVELAGTKRFMCCPGCSAVAQLIEAGGLASFYQHRTAYNERPKEALEDTQQHYVVFDDVELAATFTTIDATGKTESQLLLGGISCAACTWLIEKSLNRLPGVSRAVVSLQDARLDVQYNPEILKISEIFIHLHNLGYQPQPYEASAQARQLRSDHRTSLKRLAVAGLGMMQVGMFAIALHAGDIQGIEEKYQSLLRWVSMPVTGFVVFYAARGFFISAWRHLRHGTLVMDLPVALAIGLALTASAWATVTNSGQVYFDSVVMFTFFLLLGRFLEQGARQRHLYNWSDVHGRLPASVTVRCGNQWQMRPRIKLEGGETILIKPGDVVGIDAVVTKGTSALCEAAFTGESLPRTVRRGDAIYAGTINREGLLEATVTGGYRESRLALLMRSVRRAEHEKPALARLADRIAAWFVGGILLIAATTFLVWLQIDPARALWITLSVLVISCPCALALATPAALTAAASALRSRGVLVNSEDALESLAACSTLIFDKTGTLTEGSLHITQVALLSELGEREILQLGAKLQQYSSHPVATAFSHIAVTGSFRWANYVVGAGVEAHENNETFRIGTERFCQEIAPQLPSAPDRPLFWVALCRTDTPLAWIGLEDKLRPEAQAAIQNALDDGLDVELLTGDGSAQAAAVANTLGLATVHSGVTPQQKLERVQTLQRAGESVCMVGDGLNDAAVLSGADVSFAVAGATDLARTQASLVIVDGDLQKVNETRKLARRCRRIMKQNIIWALLYNLCAIPMAAMGLVPPWMAALGMSASSLLVVINALRLTR